MLGFASDLIYRTLSIIFAKGKTCHYNCNDERGWDAEPSALIFSEHGWLWLKEELKFQCESRLAF